MKRIGILLLALCLALSLFAGCSGDENTKDPKPTAATQPPASAPAKPTATANVTVPPTEAPTPDLNADPKVDAMLFRFWTEDEFAWENYNNASETGVPENVQIMNAEVSYEKDAGLKIIAQTEDPYFVIVPSSDTGEEFSLADYPILKIRMKNMSPSVRGELYIARGGTKIVAAEDKLPFEISANDTEFKEYIVDIGAVNGEKYLDAGEVSVMRVDAVNIKEVEPSAADSYEAGTPYQIYIDYFGFFKTTAEAEAWNPAHVTK